jgi:hypothetical protein
MLRWTWSAVVLLFSLSASRVRADTIRGVNLGGWLLVEEWYVVGPRTLRSLSMLTTKDHSIAVP